MDKKKGAVREGTKDGDPQAQVQPSLQSRTVIGMTSPLELLRKAYLQAINDEPCSPIECISSYQKGDDSTLHHVSNTSSCSGSCSSFQSSEVDDLSLSEASEGDDGTVKRSNTSKPSINQIVRVSTAVSRSNQIVEVSTAASLPHCDLSCNDMGTWGVEETVQRLQCPVEKRGEIVLLTLTSHPFRIIHVSTCKNLQKDLIGRPLFTCLKSSKTKSNGFSLTPVLVTQGRILCRFLGRSDYNNARVIRVVRRTNQGTMGLAYYAVVVSCLEKCQKEKVELVDEIPTMNISAPATLMGHYWVIPVPSLALPYANSLQNRFFFKYLGGVLFPHSTTTVLWQEASTFFTEKYMYNAPNNYLNLIPAEKDAAACFTGISMPANERNSTRTLYLEGCQTIHDMEQRQKCQSYIQQLNHSQQVDQAMISTSFLAWTNSHIDCQRFNADLQCTILEELHSINIPIDDTVLLPDAIFKHNVRAYHKGHRIKDSSPIDQQINNLELYRLDESNDHRGPMVRVIRSNCHWNRGVLGQNCKYWPEIKRRSEPDIPSETMANRTVDFHTCTSPESDIPFPMKGDVSSIFNANHTCGLNAPNPISIYLKDTIRDKVMPQLLQNCSDLVVYGVALGYQYVLRLQQSLQQQNFQRSNRLLEAHGKCFFLFVSQEDMPQRQNRPLLIGHFWFVPIPESVFPYRNPRRNAKLLKYMGQLLFSDVPTVIWQDAKLVTDFKRQQATNYQTLIRRSDTCVTTFGLPVHANTLGASNPAVLSGKTRPPDKFQAHCDTIVRAVTRRPNVTDSIDSVTQQCLVYVQHAMAQNATESLHENLVDTAFIIWNQGSNECRDFGHQFRCSLLDQIHCHSDRDQIPFPFVVQQLGLEGYYKSGGKRGLILVDDDWDPRKDDWT
ncbi:DUF616 domain containing protein [Nitzschia inconspicua]|uniref:DUF616 domain containing protein n=1 Tax=Nitzschia inconspicua TaxID=303405 RepID=A0A9K3KU70_9STRA|nr:DUF616 domain containing protein [Nitzschia inconspicua]